MAYELNEKRNVRSRHAAARRALSDAARTAAGRDLCATALSVSEVASARVVCCYVAIGPEPPTDVLLDALRMRDVRTLLPVLLNDGDLDWAGYDPAIPLVPGPRGIHEPPGARLGVDAITSADAVLVPGLAVDRTGVRLGRGAGSYDRALSRARSGTFTAILLYDHEVVDALPHEEHDQRVAAAITPTRVVRF